MISLCPRDAQESSPTPQFKSINSSTLSLLYGPAVTSVHGYWKNHSLTRWSFVSKVMSLLLDMLSRLAIAFLPRNVFISGILFFWLTKFISLFFDSERLNPGYFILFEDWKIPWRRKWQPTPVLLPGKSHG